jgi:hypothetical protein
MASSKDTKKKAPPRLYTSKDSDTEQLVGSDEGGMASEDQMRDVGYKPAESLEPFISKLKKLRHKGMPGERSAPSLKPERK